jgi:phosphoribosyl 1,2-cyclic phosphodiesterase
MSRIKFFGVRGSVSVSGRQYMEFGGNTTCVLLEGPRRSVIFDAGTGIRELGKEMMKDPRIGIERDCLIAFSHFHWDHIQGLPFFLPAYDPKRKFTISAIGRERYGKDLRGIFATQMQEEYFPVSLDGMGANWEFLQTAVDHFVMDNSFVRTLKHGHPGGAYSYRVHDSSGKVVVFCTDIEHGEHIDPRIVDFARGADILIHEGQYTPEELATHRGWGHSSWEQAVQVAEEAKVQRLVITHHDPDHDDEFLLDIEQRCQARFPGAVLAREQMEIVI